MGVGGKNYQFQDSLPNSIKIGWTFFNLFHANVPVFISPGTFRKSEIF